jgi:hypothetical protein
LSEPVEARCVSTTGLPIMTCRILSKVAHPFQWWGELEVSGKNNYREKTDPKKLIYYLIYSRANPTHKQVL